MRLLCTTGEKEGQVIDYPLHVARRMLAANLAKRVPPSAKATDVEREYARAPEPETPEAPAPDFSDWSKDELVAEAERRGLDVTRADGKDAPPLVADYLRVLGG